MASIAAAALLFVAIAASWYLISERRESTGVADNVNNIPAPSVDFGVPMDRGNPARSGVMPGPGSRGERVGVMLQRAQARFARR